MKPVTVRTQRGFTLLELSIVLIIIALVVGMSVEMGVGFVANARLTATQLKIKAIGDALMQFRASNDRLPCPGDLTLIPGSSDYGLEAGADASSAIATGTGACTGTGMLPAANNTGAGVTNTFATGAEGALPAITLGLSPDFMLDGWGNKFRYAVDISYTALKAFAINGLSCANGAVTVNDANGNARSTGSVYALVSHGPNGHGAYPANASTMTNTGSVNTAELTNCHCNSSATATTYAPTYVQEQSPTLDPTNSLDTYDDIVSFKERWQMQTAWDKTGGCPYIYVVDWGNNRVEVFTLSGNYVSQFGSFGSGNGQFNGPYFIAVDQQSNVWVTDYLNIRAEKFDRNGNYLTQVGGNWNFSYPGGVTIDNTGYLWIATDNFLGKYDTNLNLIAETPVTYTPAGIAADPSGNIWVTENWLETLGKYSNTAIAVSSFTPSGAATLGNLSGIATDASGNIWATASWTSDNNLGDPGSNQVIKFDSSGNYLLQIGCGGVEGSCVNSNAPGYFMGPQDVAIDVNGNVWVTDSGNNRVQEFNSSGSFLLQFGSSGSGNGQFNGPLGIAFGGR